MAPTGVCLIRKTPRKMLPLLPVTGVLRGMTGCPNPSGLLTQATMGQSSSCAPVPASTHKMTRSNNKDSIPMLALKTPPCSCCLWDNPTTCQHYSSRLRWSWRQRTLWLTTSHWPIDTQAKCKKGVCLFLWLCLPVKNDWDQFGRMPLETPSAPGPLTMSLFFCRSGSLIDRTGVGASAKSPTGAVGGPSLSRRRRGEKEWQVLCRLSQQSPRCPSVLYNATALAPTLVSRALGQLNLNTRFLQ